MKKIVFPMFLGFLALCGSVSAECSNEGLEEVPVKDKSYLAMVSLQGLDSTLLNSYEALTDENIDDETSLRIDFEEYRKVKANISLLSIDGKFHILFSSCNSIAATYIPTENKLKLKEIKSSAVVCERAVPDETGKMVVLQTPMLVDAVFTRVAPKIKSFSISEDNTTLNLLGANDNVLGVFVWMEAAK